tara:strand:- start:1061 stop:1714 length:654 start_codon:yes stop_codon:yes gene_type:complete
MIKFIYPKVKICKICNWSGGRFFEETRCPVCFSMPRHRFMSYILKNEDFKNKKILIIGPDMPELLMLRKKGIKDFKVLNIIDTLFTDIVCDITKSNLGKNSFDYIFMWHVLEHIIDDVLAVENIFSLLKKHGKFFFSVPIFPWGNKISYVPECKNREQKIKKMGHHDHVICCGEDYADRFNQINFTSHEKNNVKSFKKSEIEKYHLDLNHYAWILTK